MKLGGKYKETQDSYNDSDPRHHHPLPSLKGAAQPEHPFTPMILIVPINIQYHHLQYMVPQTKEGFHTAWNHSSVN